MAGHRCARVFVVPYKVHLECIKLSNLFIICEFLLYSEVAYLTYVLFIFGCLMIFVIFMDELCRSTRCLCRRVMAEMVGLLVSPVSVSDIVIVLYFSRFCINSVVNVGLIEFRVFNLSFYRIRVFISGIIWSRPSTKWRRCAEFAVPSWQVEISGR